MKFTIDAAKAASKSVVDNSSLDLKSGACLISVEVQGACGERTLAESKSLIDGEVLDSKMVSGTKLRWFPKAPLQFTNSLSKSVSRVLRQYGVSFSKGATLVPIAKLGEVAKAMEEIEVQFTEKVDELRREYDSLVAQHKTENPEVAPLISRCVEPVDKFTGRFTFKVNPPMAIQPLFDEDQQAMASTAADTLLDEVATDAAKIYHRSIAGAERAGEAKMRGIIALKDKLLNLSFIDPSIARVAMAFDELFDKLPKTYPIEGGDFQMVAHFIAAASDPDKLRMFGSNTDDDSDVPQDDTTATVGSNVPTTDAQEESKDVADTAVPAVSKETNEEVDEDTPSDPVEEIQPEPEVVEQTPVVSDAPTNGAFVFDGW